jgi:hypothetical protein
MTLTAVFGFLGVLLGSGITAFVTVYREQIASLREREAREIQRRRERQDQATVFQRENILALQGVLSELELAVYREQDRMLVEMKRVGSWPARQWETPTAEAWHEAFIRAEALRARLFDDQLRQLATEIGDVSRDSVWSKTIEDAEKSNESLRDLSARFNQRVSKVLPELF